ncbi:MAG: extracellular solute-binding protein, partial [Chloroflexota bacterium]
MRKKSLWLVISLMLIAAFVFTACQQAPAEEAPEAEEAVVEVVEEAEEVEEEPAAPAEKVQVRWFVGLGTGTDEPQIAAQESVVAAFNESQDRIELILEIVPNAQARDTLSTQIAADAGPDIIGPVGIAGSNWFYGQFLDMTPLIESANYDTTQFEEALVKFFQTEEGQVGLPFAVYPTALFYQKEMFDEAGLNYPPQSIGDKYVMPDGSEVEWSWDTLTEVAKLLTVDINGLTPLDDGFDRDNIVQVGYAWPHLWPSVMGTFSEPGLPFAGEAGAYTADIPAGWEAAWRWYYEGVYGDEPFIPSGPLAESPEFGSGNVFNGGRSAMAVTQLWYAACCVSDAGDSWD